MFHIATGVFIVLVEVVAVRDLGGAQALGLITASLGVGGLVGGLVALRLQPRRMLLWAFVALGLFALLPARVRLARAASGPSWPSPSSRQARTALLRRRLADGHPAGRPARPARARRVVGRAHLVRRAAGRQRPVGSVERALHDDRSS